MSKRNGVVFSWQDAFQRECLLLYKRLINDAKLLAGDGSHKTNMMSYTSLLDTKAQIEKVRKAGLIMVHREPNSPLVVQHREYWCLPVQATDAEQTVFEYDCWKAP